MNRKITVQRLIADPPAEAPQGWIVFNAPRPLYGKEWKGDFVHGIFYVAIDPQDDHAERQIKDNVSNDGWIVDYVSWLTVMEWVREYAKEMEFDVEELEDKDILQSYYLNCGRIEIDYPENIATLFEIYGVKHGA